jgi:hypothetical protein
METDQLQAAYAALDAALPEPDESGLVMRAKIRGLLAGYHNRYAGAELAPIEVEKTEVAPLINPETRAKSRTFTLAGKLDVVVLVNGRPVVIDHKTTSEEIADPAAVFWRRLRVEAQPSHYMLLKWLNGQKIESALWDVVRKPSIRPKKLAKKDCTGAILQEEYCGRKLSHETLACLKLEPVETAEMYEARLAHDCIEERPNWYFQRQPVPRLDDDLIHQAQELWDYSQEILAARRNNRWGQNDGACLLYGSPCPYLGVCSGYDNTESDTWQREANVHTELPELDGDGRDVLTYSRLRVFKTCRRKHYYRYELGITRQDDDREALIFGSLWHTALEAYWTYLLPGESHGESDPAIGVGEQRRSDSAATESGVRPDQYF